MERAEERLERLADLHIGAGMGNADQFDRLYLPYANMGVVFPSGEDSKALWLPSLR
ncbi:hypothetical protein GGD56_002471 [Rhizobium mongolense]|uniref:Uncharacterized protein n=1 Tax=Rhizobium mongolense TaxID=57676 RepID=A0ABR6IL91_9HYPH|nr:hypothetical protein [Rhizobium mongolense]